MGKALSAEFLCRSSVAVQEMFNVDHNSEQRQSGTFPSYLCFQSSSARLQQRGELDAHTDHEQTELPDQPTTSLSIVHTVCDQTSHLNNTVSCADEMSSSTEKEGNVMSDFMNLFHGTEDLNKEKDITFLLKELDVLRASNKKLQNKLSEKDKELKTIKLDLELCERATEAKIAEKAAALVEEIHSAQRGRDEAIMARLKLANEERDDACKRIKVLEQSFETLENINPEENDMTLQELLNRINNADTSMAIRRSGAIIVDRIYRTQERKKKITAEEMNAVIEERDAALAQCKRLEQELHHMKEQNQTSANNTRHLTAENNQERALKPDPVLVCSESATEVKGAYSQGKLLAMQQEREAAVQQYKGLEEEIETLRVYYSLHQSLSQEVNLKDQFNSTLMTYEKALKNREEIVSMLLLQNEELVAQLQQAVEERANMELKFQQALETSQEASEKLQNIFQPICALILHHFPLFEPDMWKLSF
ncbi:mirror-image polydactyly gene 1 protein isoform X2 [Hemicordylus capensis]|uniref:mirror-image polydactyly gene 1 protein isoform X2 n=1 Tax=Hemicordylus capensis TaxID=884348 RepID=UPI0023037204|nr:mirror-image polydactyly gene 1 protein isoform X2 [Hemicordylus capensis]